jgi:hypothetical protein
MAGAGDLKKTVSIILNLKGGRETKRAADDVYASAHKGNEQLQRDSKRSAEGVELFLRKWKYELLLVGGALGGLWGLAKYSPVAASMIDMVGTALGYLATVILMPLLPYVMLLVLWIIQAAEAFDRLPQPIKDAVAALLGLFGLWKLLQFAGVIDLAKKLIPPVADKVLGPLLDGWEALAKEGGAKAALAWIAAFLGGLALGSLIVGLMDKLGITAAIDKMGRDLEAKHPVIFQALKVILFPFKMLDDIRRDIISGNWSKIPDDIGKTWETVKGILASWGVPKGAADVVAFLAGIPATFALYKGLQIPKLIEWMMGDYGKKPGLPDLAGWAKKIPGLGDIYRGLPKKVPVGAEWMGGSAGKVANVLAGTLEAWEASLAAGGAAGAGAFLAALGAGLVAGLAGVAVLVHTGALDWVRSMGQAVNDSAPWFMDILKVLFAPLGAIGAAAIDIVTGQFGRIPEDVASVFTQAYDAALDIWTRLTDAIKARWEGAIGWVIEEIRKIPGGEALVSKASKALKSYATGGYVAQDGPAMLHAGDWIRSKYGDTTRDSTGRGVDHGGGSGSGFTITGPVTIVTQATDAAGLKRDLLRELGSMARRS